MCKNLAGSFCFGFDISEDIKKWGRKVKWLIKDLENGVRVGRLPWERENEKFQEKTL